MESIPNISYAKKGELCQINVFKEDGELDDDFSEVAQVFTVLPLCICPLGTPAQRWAGKVLGPVNTKFITKQHSTTPLAQPTLLAEPPIIHVYATAKLQADVSNLEIVKLVLRADCFDGQDLDAKLQDAMTHYRQMFQDAGDAIPAVMTMSAMLGNVTPKRTNRTALALNVWDENIAQENPL